MVKVGLTGGIGSGKTTVARIFEVLGIPVYYADAEARRLMNTDPELKKQIIEVFGPKSYNEGNLNRPWLAAQVFHNTEKLNLLNSFVHPLTIRDAESWMKRQTAAYSIKEAALIFEGGLEKNLDYVIGVTAPESLRLERTIQRDKISAEEVLLRMQQQMNDEEKMSRCDFTIINDGRQAVIPQVLAIHETLKASMGV